MRAKRAAALTNFVVILLLRGLVMAFLAERGRRLLQPCQGRLPGRRLVVLVLAFIATPLAGVAAGAH